MIDRLMPIFAVIGILSSTVYLSLAAWMLYESVFKRKALCRHNPQI
ncbi:hypothetical protein KCG53_06760 [Neisseria subflava]|uniref:Uncharacterized protein n=1 Tax=Neisseria subflava TaxID=28449 RepID=A0A9X9I4L2_NEISU|nr:hypothetical protein KCG53_06760 [Neisseria subflava]